MIETIRLIAIADPAGLAGREMIEACRAAEAGGATSIQVRMKQASAAELLEATESLIAVLSIPIYVNDRADIAWLAGAQGVHVGAEDVPASRLREFARPPFRIGVSVGSRQEADAVAEAGPDYWSVGSVYSTPSKPDAGVPLGPSGFRELARLAPPGVPVVAIGGIGASNVAEILGAGADGIAVISAVFGASDIESATRQLRDAVDTAAS